MQVALVTGANGGIGRATVERLRQQGVNVVAVDVHGPESSTDTGVLWLHGSVCDEAFMADVSRTVGERYGHLNTLVNIAGINYFSRIEDCDLEAWRRMFDVNVLGMVVSIKHLVPLLRQGEAPAIVNMSSISAHIGSVGYAAYVATKGAVDSLTKSLALELAPTIRVNAIAPGWIETQFTVDGLEKAGDPVAYRREVESMHALGRVGSPQDIANAIVWMASPEASFMTGSLVTVDGGYMIKN